MAALVKAALEARPAPGPVEAVTLRVRPVRVPAAQVSIEDPLRPSPRLITATLARVAALVGAGQVGVPRLIDSHRPDSVTLDHDVWPGQQPSRPRPAPVSAARAVLALRRIRPPVPAAVTLAAGRPVEFRSRRLAARIVASVGPWRVSGEWWTERSWFRDEWDVELSMAPIAPGQQVLICRLVHDGSAWWLEGIYD
jgi:protein ImuB